MKFQEMLDKLKKGKKARRKSWSKWKGHGCLIYLKRHDVNLWIDDFPYVANIDDYEADDWEIAR